MNPIPFRDSLIRLLPIIPLLLMTPSLWAIDDSRLRGTPSPRLSLERG